MGELDRSVACEELSWRGLPLAGRRRLTPAEDDALRQPGRQFAVSLAVALVVIPVLLTVANLPGMPFMFCGVIGLVLLIYVCVLYVQAVEAWQIARDRRHGWVYVFGDEGADSTGSVLLLRSGRRLDAEYTGVVGTAAMLGVRGDFERHLAGQAVAPVPAWFDLTARPDGSGVYCACLPQVASRPLGADERSTFAAAQQRARSRGAAVVWGTPAGLLAAIALGCWTEWYPLAGAAVVCALPALLLCLEVPSKCTKAAERYEGALRDGGHHGFLMVNYDVEGSAAQVTWLDLLGGGYVHLVDGRAPGEPTVWPMWRAAMPPGDTVALPDGAHRQLTSAELAEFADDVGALRREGLGCVPWSAALFALMLGVTVGVDVSGWPLAALSGLLLACVYAQSRREPKAWCEARADLADGYVLVCHEQACLGDDYEDGDGEPRTCVVERLPRLNTEWTVDGIPSPARPFGSWSPHQDFAGCEHLGDLDSSSFYLLRP